MRKSLYLFLLVLFSLAIISSAITDSNIDREKTPFVFCDSLYEKVHPFVKNLFYNLPLDKTRKEIREIIIEDKRFISTDSVFNNYQPSSFFKGITFDKGLVTSKPDSIEVLLAMGNTSISVHKGGESEFNDIMILNCRYFYSSKYIVQIEFERLLNSLKPILNDSITGKSESRYLIGKTNGTMIVNEVLFESYKPYYRVGVSTISMIPDNRSKSTFVLEIVFGKVDE
jgi:hypothetical protein